MATVVIAAWEGDIDRAQTHRVLNGDLSEWTDDLLFEADAPTANPPRA